MENKKELIELFDKLSQASKELDKALDELNKQLIELLELRIKEMSKEGTEECPKVCEKIKSFEECTLGEKFILYLLDKNKIHVNENMIEDAEAFIYNNVVLDFMIMQNKTILDELNTLLNSLYEVDIDKLRVKKG